MTAKICDRCGRLYEPYLGRDIKNRDRANGVLLVDEQKNSRFHAERTFYELCPKCMAELEDFLKGESDDG